MICIGGADFLAKLAFVILGFILEFFRCEHVLCIDYKQEVFVALKMDVPSVFRGRDVSYGFGIPWILAVNDAETVRKHVSDDRVPFVDHERRLGDRPDQSNRSISCSGRSRV